MCGNERLKAHALAIFRAGLAAVDPLEAVTRTLSMHERYLTITDLDEQMLAFPMSEFERVIVVGAGKAGGPMAAGVERVLGDLVEGGIVVVKDGYKVPTRKVELVEASHPLPDHRGLSAARRMVDLLARADRRTLVLCLISGGGSSLLCLPAEGISLEDKVKTTDLLLRAGADIHEVNTVRKHLSAVKGGRFARIANPATMVTLVLSDVVGDRLESIASGPTVPDPSTFAQARGVLQEYGCWEKSPPSVRALITAGTEGRAEETPKPGDTGFERCHAVLVGTNSVCLYAAARKAQELGYHVRVMSSTVQGGARLVAKAHAQVARTVRLSSRPIPPPACLLWGGETTVTVEGDGNGGRNQELALAAALEIAGLEQVAVVSVGTDGTDGPTHAAGAIAFGDTVSRASAMGLDPSDYLARNDSHTFFERLGDLVVTGPTGTNVMDVHMVLVDRLE